jgi:hypothetical protein
MENHTFKLRESDKGFTAKIIAVIVVTLLVQIYWDLCDYEYCFYLIWGVWAIVWLPVLLGYFATLLVSVFVKKRMGTKYRCVSTIIGVIAGLLYSFIVDTSESVGTLIGLYTILIVPLQLVCIIVIDMFIHYCSRHCTRLDI